jgi:uncharacterized protein (UPF0548 family)
MFALGRPSDARLAAVLAEMAGADLTYPEVGATGRPGPLPAGYDHARETAVVGHGDDAFAAAVAGFQGWQLHRGQGFRVVPADPPVAPGTEVVVGIPLGPGVYVIAACRVVWTVDEPDRFGFAYGTLPAHPASGEEAFVVERLPGGEVRGVVTAFSRPRHPLVRLGRPVARRQQQRATRGYLAALARWVSSAPSSG